MKDCEESSPREETDSGAGPPLAAVRLENQLCFSIYAASRAITHAYRPLLENINLTYPQYLVLLALWETDDTTVSELGRRVMLDFGTLTPLLKRLEARKLVRRMRDASDERHVRISLTQAGRDLQGKARTIPSRLRCQISLS